MKIKNKKQINLPQLIEWAWDNNVKNETFIADKQLTNIEFDDTGDVLIYGNDNKKTVKFSIEVEEEITEETHLDYLYALTNDDEKEIHRCMNFTIRNASMVIGRNDLTFFTLIDNDLVKIYENGKLVD